MRETSYSEAASQVLGILNYTNQEEVRKIPQSFIKFLTQIASKSRTEFNYDKPIDTLNLTRQTKEILGFIYITWWCDEKKRNNYKNIIYANNQKKEQINNYDIQNIFKDRKQIRTDIVVENHKKTAIVEYKEENVFKKFLNRILSFFNNTKGDLSKK